jgi:hypothetical protein
MVLRHLRSFTQRSPLLRTFPGGDVPVQVLPGAHGTKA